MNEPTDEPEGAAVVLMSATLFKEWCAQTGATIVDWGTPEPWSGHIYTPVVRRDEPVRDGG